MYIYQLPHNLSLTLGLDCDVCEKPWERYVEQSDRQSPVGYYPSKESLENIIKTTVRSADSLLISIMYELTRWQTDVPSGYPCHPS